MVGGSTFDCDSHFSGAGFIYSRSCAALPFHVSEQVETAMQRLLQWLLLGCILRLGLWVSMPAAAEVGFGLAALALVLTTTLRRPAPASVEGTALVTLWTGSLVVWFALALSNITWDSYYAALAGLMSIAVWLTARQTGAGILRTRWNAAVMAWLLAGATMWLGSAYLQNQRSSFYLALLAMLAALSLCRLWFRWGAGGAQTIHTLILLMVALPVFDLVVRSRSRIAVGPENCQLYYSYNASKGDPESFERWQEFYQTQFDQLGLEIFMPDPKSRLPFRLRPGSRATLIRCPISINRRGFRGPEFDPGNDGGYRIVALGESTTFGMTTQPGDKPWPEVLEELIRERLKTKRPVHVINAGVPAYSLFNNLGRLPDEILPLHPDMIISYHGANGFHTLDNSVLPPLGPIPPIYRERPIKLAAEAEHRLRLWLYAWRARRHRVAVAPAASPMGTLYATAYLQLIECARTNGIRLALANFSMAVNEASDSKVIDFYQGGGSRAAYSFIRANAIHSRIVTQIASEHPEVCFVDTHPHLDGDHEKFIDVIHFTGEGDRQLADNIYAGIKATLQRDLSTETQSAR